MLNHGLGRLTGSKFVCGPQISIEVEVADESK